MQQTPILSDPNHRIVRIFEHCYFRFVRDGYGLNAAGEHGIARLRGAGDGVQPSTWSSSGDSIAEHFSGSLLQRNECFWRQIHTPADFFLALREDIVADGDFRFLRLALAEIRCCPRSPLSFSCSQVLNPLAQHTPNVGLCLELARLYVKDCLVADLPRQTPGVDDGVSPQKPLNVWHEAMMKTQDRHRIPLAQAI
jgi:hypothetical protein